MKRYRQNDNADYGVSEKNFSEREYPEKEHPLRNPFQRDRDRVVHSKAFRRLEYKTQVFVNHVGDNYRTRLTHSLEVSQISRSVARSLRVNEDLVESIALAHDLGHPPFGHAGERALHRIMKAHGGFDHNQHTLRLLTFLEKRYPHFTGLNLTKATLLGLQKHDKLPGGRSHFIEALVVDICDEIAYNNHDIDDGLESGLLNPSQLKEVEIWQENWEEVYAEYPGICKSIQIYQTIRMTINSMVMDLVEESLKNIGNFSMQSLDDVLDFKKNHPKEELIGFSTSFAPKVVELKKFLHKKLYQHPEIKKSNVTAQHTIEKLFHYFSKNLEKLPSDFRDRADSIGKQRSICDFIAGMTDRYALNWLEKIT